MNLHSLDPLLVLVLLLNFYVLAVGSLRSIVFAVAAQGVLLAAIYPFAHAGLDGVAWPAMARLWGLALVMATVKGVVIPRLILKAMHDADVPRYLEPIGGFTPTLVLAAIGTAAAIVYAKNHLTLAEGHKGDLIVGTALSTSLIGFLMLVLRREALTQVLGYIVLENGIFIFGLLLVEALPGLVEFGVLLDLFVGVFVMGIIINHVSRAFPSASTEHLTSLRE